MPESRLEATSILQPALAELSGQDGNGELVLGERAFQARFVLRALEPLEALNRRLSETAGITLDDTPNRVQRRGEWLVFWLRPDHWQVTGPEADHASLTEQLGRAVADTDSSVVDVSDYYTLLVLTGERARDVLMKGCPFDLHPGQFDIGAMALTRVAQADVLLHHVAEHRYELQVRNSFAEYALKWLFDAGLEYGIRIAEPTELNNGVKS